MVSWTVDVLRVPEMPPPVELTVRVTLPWKKFKLCKLSVIVVFEPAWMVAEFGVAVMLKSVATRVREI
jgi:hypothetical protein